MNDQHLPVDCRRMEQLRDRRLMGETLTEEERRDWESHLAVCEQCRSLEQGLEAIRFDPQDPPTEPLDDVTSHRLISEVLDRARERGMSEAAPLASSQDGALDAEEGILDPAARSRKGRPLSMGVIKASLLAAALAVVAMGIYLSRSADKDSKSGDKVGRQPIAKQHSRLDGEAVLVAGAALQDGRPLPVGTKVRMGGLVAARDGQTTLAIPRLGLLHLRQGSVVTLQPRRHNDVGLVIRQGAVEAYVNPASKLKLSILAGKVRVHVLGTFLRVSRIASRPADCIEVSVLHGLVSVQGPGLDERISDGQSYDTCRAHKAPLGSRVTKDLWSQEDRLHMLSSTKAALLTVRSTKPGALVMVDGIELGETPLTAMVKPGRRTLEVRMDGATVLSDRVDLAAGKPLRRFCDVTSPGPRAPSSDTVALNEPPPGNETPPKARRSIARRGPARQSAAPVPRTSHQPRATGPSPATRLLEQAQALRSRRNWRAAAKAYAAVVRRYRGRREARVALLSLAAIELEHLGHPRKALALFRRYLSQGGGLAQEARWGIIQALRALGKKREERAALQDFLARYPHSVRAERIRKQMKPQGARQTNARGER